ncbi:single-stranded DNA-binding protein [Spirosoma sp.]|uniref:single-stranded DNA-binding protein n=1 Tax=Spirosoma sp. TaxID=1899569 RepID=UPI002610D15F|nr:single-stranded DNA-binding protein [Spirosoma sp.]MCX6216589.1 single-stranded DNA-binding protein [Spirosoma sp.]
MKLNQIQAIGRIGQDAKIVDHQGRKFVAFSIGVDESYKDRNGVKVERVAWFDCVSEQERFFNVASWLTKGREVLVEGKPSVRTWEKDGRTNASIRIQISNISLGNSPNDVRPTAAPVSTPAPAPFVAVGSADETGDDLPF